MVRSGIFIVYYYIYYRVVSANAVHYHFAVLFFVFNTAGSIGPGVKNKEKHYRVQANVEWLEVEIVMPSEWLIISKYSVVGSNCVVAELFIVLTTSTKDVRFSILRGCSNTLWVNFSEIRGRNKKQQVVLICELQYCLFMYAIFCISMKWVSLANAK